jgi:hypothetical protein
MMATTTMTMRSHEMATKKTTKTAPTKATKTRETPSPKPTKAAPAGKSKANGVTPTKPDAKPKRLSALDAAAELLAETGEPMTCKAMVEAMAQKGLWTSPAGKTPVATLYSAILRELATKGEDARFKRAERGQFTAN